jgi:hypothetical protein
VPAWPEQHAYELIRPVVLFGQLPAERAQQTGVAQGWQLPLPSLQDPSAADDALVPVVHRTGSD